VADEYIWDEKKREKTLKERGLDFNDMEYFDWDNALTIEDIDSDSNELRFVSIGYLRDKIVVVVWCYRGDEIRIISMRKATRKEKKRYED